MARKAREYSSIDIYHIMLRGIDKRDLFYDKEDYSFFINRLACITRQMAILPSIWLGWTKKSGTIIN